MLLVDSKIESYKVISIVWQSTYFKISVNFDDVSPMKIILQTLSSSFLGDLKGSSMTRWQEPGGSQRHMLEQKKTHARIHFPAPNPMLLYLNFPRVNSLCKDGLISFTFRWLRFLFKMSAGLSPHPAPPPPQLLVSQKLFAASGKLNDGRAAEPKKEKHLWPVESLILK